MAQAVSAPQGLGVQRGSGAIISVGLSCLAVAMLQSNQSSFCHWVAFSVLPSSIMLWVSPAVRGLGFGEGSVLRVPDSKASRGCEKKGTFKDV